MGVGLFAAELAEYGAEGGAVEADQAQVFGYVDAAGSGLAQDTDCDGVVAGEDCGRGIAAGQECGEAFGVVVGAEAAVDEEVGVRG